MSLKDSTTIFLLLSIKPHILDRARLNALGATFDFFEESDWGAVWT